MEKNGRKKVRERDLRNSTKKGLLGWPKETKTLSILVSKAGKSGRGEEIFFLR